MLKPQDTVELLKVIWTADTRREYTSESGGAVTIRKRGEYDDATDRFKGAEIETGGVVYCGDIVVWAGKYPPHGDYENAVLHVAPHSSACIMKNDGTPVVQVVSPPDPVCKIAYETLKDGREGKECSGHIARMEDLQRIAMFTRLLIDRLKRKSDEIKAVYENNYQNWNETMYITLMGAMGAPRNKKAYTELAGRVKYSMLARERNTPQYVESLLLGASGLLELYDDDSYIRDLKSNFDYLRRKHNIMPMMPMQWDTTRSFPYGNHVLRLAQLSAFLATRDFLFDNIIKCRTVEDLHRVFRAEASDYWSTHHAPAASSARMTKRIGHEKANVLGINVAVPLIFTYGDYMKEEHLKDEAIDLLEKINCEQNGIVNDWKRGGVVMESAFDSQAILQLNNEYCVKGLCWKCPVGKKIIKGNFNSRTA